MDKLLTLKETEELLNVSKSTLQRWDNSGKLVALRTEGGHRRYKLSDIEKILGKDENKVQLDNFITYAWCWFEPYLVAQGVCRESINACYELFLQRMKNIINK